MSAVKPQHSDRVRSLAVLKTPPGKETVVSEARSYADLLSEVETLALANKAKDKQIADYKQQLATAEKRQSDAVAAAQASARQDERQTIVTDSRATIERGVESLLSGQKVFETFLSESESLALIIAETALRKVFTAYQPRSQLVASAISRCVSEISARTVVTIRLSSDDFGAPSEIHDYAPQLERQHLSFEIDPTLRSGDCEFELLVGQLEISLDRHWEKLEALLRSLRSGAVSSPSEGVLS